MKMRTIYLSCMALMSLAIMSCSDDSDKIDSFFKEKVSKLENNKISVNKVYPNTAIFENVYNEKDLLYHCYISTSKEDLESGRHLSELKWSIYLNENNNRNAYVYSLEPNTTYYYRFFSAYTQLGLDGYGTVWSETQQFTTPKLTAGKFVSFDSENSSVLIETPLWGGVNDMGFNYADGGIYIYLYSDSDMKNYVPIYNRTIEVVNEMQCIRFWIGQPLKGQTYYYQLYYVSGWGFSDYSEMGQFTL